MSFSIPHWRLWWRFNPAATEVRSSPSPFTLYPFLSLLFLSSSSPSQPLFVWLWTDQTKPNWVSPVQGDCQRWFFNLTARIQWVLDSQAKFPSLQLAVVDENRTGLCTQICHSCHYLLYYPHLSLNRILPREWGYNGLEVGVFVSGPHVPGLICFIKELHQGEFADFWLRSLNEQFWLKTP